MKSQKCCIEGCEDTGIKRRGLCHKHYQYYKYRKRLNEFPLLKSPIESGTKCIIENCQVRHNINNQRLESGLCLPHYIKKNKKKYQYNLLVKVFTHYGLSCICCGESNILFLTLGHKNNDGNKHRLELKISGLGLYTWLVNHNFKTKYELQTECYNCNCAKRRNNNICPHKTINPNELFQVLNK